MSTDPREFEHPIDGTTPNELPTVLGVGSLPPPLVEVIAAALAGHWAFSAHTEPFVDRCDGCGEVVHTNGTQLKHALAAHQARALLDAISEAGAVEWATEHVAQGSRTIEIHPCDSEADAQGAIAYYGGRILSRITGPWTAVEG